MHTQKHTYKYTRIRTHTHIRTLYTYAYIHCTYPHTPHHIRDHPLTHTHLHTLVYGAPTYDVYYTVTPYVIGKE